MAKDPVCGMDVDEATAMHTAQHSGQTYYFCAPGCKKAFEAEPHKYLDSSFTAPRVTHRLTVPVSVPGPSGPGQRGWSTCAPAGESLPAGYTGAVIGLGIRLPT